MLEAGHCSAYEDRPLACRTYDCRVYAATGIAPDRDAIAAQVRRWHFGYPSADDRQRRAAVLAAVRFVREHPECLPAEAARLQPIRTAVIALAVHEMFLPAEAARAEAGEEAPALLSDADRAHAVRAANERLFGDG